MPRSLVLGNGNILVCLDKYGQVRDFYFPHVGLENHVAGHFNYVHRIGVWVDHQLRWIGDGTWDIHIDCAKETLASHIEARNEALGVTLTFHDAVYNEKNIFLRRIIVRNLRDQKRQAKLFFHQQFEIMESHRGDTGYYDPQYNTVVHYKGHRIFLINAKVGDRAFDDYSIGIFGLEGKEGTYKDAEDGVLSKNPVEHGKVDSVIGLALELAAGGAETAYYWISMGKSMREASELNKYVQEKSPQHLVKTTEDFWTAWVNRQNITFADLDAAVVELFKKSLFIIRAHVDTNGSILASGDSDMLQYGRDTYSYMWPRDGAQSAIALDKAGDSNVAKRFFTFCNDVISHKGYFKHKYRADKSLGSSWHPWIRDGKPSLPIQEDETALVLWALWKHYELTKDLEFIEAVYNSLIKKSADFIVDYINPANDLPKPSYDLWEEKFGVHTFTAGTVYGALRSAAKFADLLGKTDAEKTYLAAAERIKAGILKHLYDETDGTFCKMITEKDGIISTDKTLDMSSVYGIYAFDVLGPDDPRLVRAIRAIEERLCCHTPVGGVPRYAGDAYYQVSHEVPGNPWFITTLWLAQYYTAAAKTPQDLEAVKQWLSWTVKYALPSGVLSEQLHPYTGEQISAAPLTWSHAEFIVTVMGYVEKLKELGARHL